MFGNNQNKFSFGTGTSSGFGSSTGFGTNTSSSTFGNTPAFGQTQTKSVFGNNNNTPSSGSLFGSSTGFSTNTSTSGFTGFGVQNQNNTSSTGLFGGTSQAQSGNSMFGQPSTLFGAKTTASGFGASNTSGGLFGSNNTSSSSGLFGNTTSTGLFSSSISTSGTTIKFQPMPSTDTMMKSGTSQTVNTKHQCITAMKEYEQKSLEELRLEDYDANRKGATSGNTSLFGQSQATTNTFGTTPTTSTGNFGAFGTNQASTGGLFGAKKDVVSNSTGFNFGQPQSSQSGGLFGQTTSSAPTFSFGGSTTNSTSLFGQQNKPSGFNTTTTQAQPTLFGATNTNFGGFGQNNQQNNMFGQKATVSAPTFSFGQPQQQTTTAFTGFGQNTSNSTGTSLFGQQKPAFGTSFGTSTSNTPSFGTQNTNLFGSNQQKPTFTMGLGNTSGTGLFGNTSSSLGAFGSSISSNSTNQNIPLSNGNDSNKMFQNVLLTQNPYGDLPLLPNFETKRKDDVLKPTNAAAQKAAISPAFNSTPNRRSTPRLSNRIRPKPLNSNSSSIFDGLEDDDDVTVNFTRKSNIKKLVFKKKTESSFNSSTFNEKSMNGETTPNNNVSPVAFDKQQNKENTFVIQDNKHTVRKILEISENDDVSDDGNDSTKRQPHPSGIILNRCDYYTIPDWNDLIKICDDDKRCVVDNFVIGRHGYGNVYFYGKTDLTGLNLDELVHFRKNEVNVYVDDENKPKIGEGLNKRAQITLDNVWPEDKSTRKPIKDYERLTAMKYKEKLEKTCLKIDAKFLDYRPDTGSWVFEVKHFTRYGLLDDDDDADFDFIENIAPVVDKKPKLMSNIVEKLPCERPVEIVDVQPGEDVETDAKILDNNSLMTETIMKEPAQSSIPISHQLAVRLGVNAYDVQMMKASFFDEEEYEDDCSKMQIDERVTPLKKVHSSKGSGLGGSICNLLKSNIVFDEEKRFSPEQIVDMCPLKKFDETVEPEPDGEIIITGFNKDIDVDSINTNSLHPWFVPFKESLTSSQTHALSRSFRCGWSSKFLFRPFVDIDNVIVGTPFKIDNILFLNKGNISKCATERLLQTALEFTQIHLSQDNSSAPFFDVEEDNKLLHSYVDNLQGILHDITDDNVLKYSLSVWKLCVCLWSNLNQEEYATDYEIQMLRKDYVTEWLQQYAIESITHDTSNVSHESKIFAELTAKRLQNACNIAMKCGNFKMALLLSQACSSEKTKQLIRTQLACWQQTEADLHIDNNYLKIYTLLSGCMIWNGNDITVNVCKNLEWKRALALHIWFYCKKTDTIEGGLKAYDNAYQGLTNHGIYCNFPFADYDQATSKDVCYQLLKLFADKKSVNLAELLSTSSYCNNPLDVRLSWHLWHILNSLGYKYLENDCTENLHSSYAWFLESLGSYKWAIFVVLHIKDYKKREKLLRDILHKNCIYHKRPKNSEECLSDEEKFIIETLNVPKRYIFEAKALKAKSEGDFDSECWYLLKSEKFSECEKLLVEKVAPHSLFLRRNSDIGSIKDILEGLECAYQAGHKITSWSIYGKVLYDYVAINSSLENLANCGHMDNCSVDLLTKDLNDLFDRIDRMKINDKTMSFVQDEMKKRTRNIMRVLEMLEKKDDGNYELPEISSSSLARRIEHKYALKSTTPKLLKLVESFLRE